MFKILTVQAKSMMDSLKTKYGVLTTHVSPHVHRGGRIIPCFHLMTSPPISDCKSDNDVS